MVDRWTLTLTLTGPRGERHVMAVDTDAFDGAEWFGPTPPTNAEFAKSMEEVARPMKRREYRKHVLRNQCLQLATALGERMEDKEGWHGVDRQEKTIAHELQKRDI